MYSTTVPQESAYCGNEAMYVTEKDPGMDPGDGPPNASNVAGPFRSFNTTFEGKRRFGANSTQAASIMG